ncbi:MAG: transposase [Candidatus Omnitrophica bacterium]|nr:transposase [Candidatus Omnitrophota bacterium]MBU1932922.1 transposase [Candidatus Omnitrophota bacterium]
MNLIDEGRLKRYFRARNKIAFEGAILHITQHATGFESLFLEEVDYLHMLYLIKEVSKSFKFGVLSFALMLNHLHLLIEMGGANLSEIMECLFKRYAFYFNSKYNRKGHVFSGSFRSALCLDDSYLLSASLYIHLNPVKAGIVEDPAGYRWSSCNLFSRDTNIASFVDYTSVLDLLNLDTQKARVSYRQLLEGMRKEKLPDTMKQPKATEEIVKAFNKALNDIEGLVLPNGSLSECQSFEHQIQALKNKGRLRGSRELEIRRLLIRRLMNMGYSIPQIADRFRISKTAIYNTLNLTKLTM